MPVGRQIAEAIETHQPTLTRREVRNAVIASLEAVALPEPEKRYADYPHQFSGGPAAAHLNSHGTREPASSFSLRMSPPRRWT